MSFARLVLVTLLIVFSSFLVPGDGAAQVRKPHAEVTQEVRNGDVEQKLRTNADTVAVYAQGLCCMSCGIGVRKKVKDLAFVDHDRFKHGVALDPKTQIVSIAIKKGARADSKAIRQAVLDAGYEPVHLYRLVDNKLVTQDLKAK